MSPRQKIEYAMKLLREVESIADEVAATPAVGTGIRAEALQLRTAAMVAEAARLERTYWEEKDAQPARHLRLTGTDS